MSELVPIDAIAAEAVEHLLDRAFGRDRHGRTAYLLRAGTRAIPALSFAACDTGAPNGGELLGTIQCWPAWFIGDDGCRAPLVLVGPVAVAPERQQNGVGRRLMQAALDLTLPYVRERKQFDVAIGTFQLMQAKVADMYTALASSRSFAYQIARDYDAGHKSRVDAAACVMHASEAAINVTLEAIQALGGNGYINEFPAGRLLRDAKLYAIGAGTNEIRRMLIGRELFNGHG